MYMYIFIYVDLYVYIYMYVCIYIYDIYILYGYKSHHGARKSSQAPSKEPGGLRLLVKDW